MASLLDLETAILSPKRQIGPFSAGALIPVGVSFQPLSDQVTVRELTQDEITITKHPVQQGAAMTDHAYKEPSIVVLDLGWSNSGLNALVNDITALTTLLTGEGTGGFNYSDQIYNALLGLQLSRVPFDLTTGKRQYTNMLLKSMSVPTTNETENALFVTAICQQVLIAQTQDVTFPSSTVQANPASTSATASTGTVQPAVTAFVLRPDGSIGQQVPVASDGT